MSTNHHTPTAVAGQPAVVADVLVPDAALDQAITDLNTKVVVSIDTDGTLKAGAVDVAAVLANGVVTAPKLAADAVTTSAILDENVTAAKIGPNAVTNAKMADASVGTNEIIDANVTAPKLAAGVISTALAGSGLVPLARYTQQEGPLTYPAGVAAGVSWQYTEHNTGKAAVLYIEDSAGTKLPITGGTGFVGAAATDNLVDPAITGNILGRHLGRTIYARVKGSSFRLGFQKYNDTSQNIRSGVQATSGAWFACTATGFASTGITHTAATTYDLLITQADAGATIFYKDATASEWELLWAAQTKDSGNNNASSPTRLVFTYGSTLTQLAVYEVATLGGVWSKAFGPSVSSTYRVLSLPYSGDLPTGDGFFGFDADVAASDTVEIRFRVLDANNYLAFQALETANQVQIIKMEAGVQSIISNGGVAQTYAVVTGAVHRFEVRLDGSDIRVLALPGSSTLATATDAFNVTETGWEIPNTVLSTISRFAAFNLYGLPTVPQGSGAEPIHYVTSGDSKTQGGLIQVLGDHVSVGRYGAGFSWALSDELERVRGAGAYEALKDATGGRTMADWLGDVPATIAAVEALAIIPDILFLNMGTNHRGDTADAGDMADMQDDLAAGLDLWHAAFPTMYVAYTLPSGSSVGAGGPGTGGWTTVGADDTLAEYLLEVFGRYHFCVLNVDERPLYRDSTLLLIGTDGTHPSYDGYIRYGKICAWTARRLFPTQPALY